MDIETRIRRRQNRNRESRLVEEYAPLTPVCHVSEPTGRGQVVEELLDHLAPVFDGALPPDLHIHGPAGSGKSAVLATLFDHLNGLLAGTEATIGTTTRAQTIEPPEFVYLDARLSTSEFEFYRRLLDALVEESVPTDGIGTDTLRQRLRTLMGGTRELVVAVDHVGEPGTVDGRELLDLIDGLPGVVSLVSVSRDPPEATDLGDQVEATVEFDTYQHRTLVDIVMTRASSGLSGGSAFDHALARRVADWADGNAHDALAVLFVAAISAEESDRVELAEEDVVTAAEDVPTPSVPLGRVLSLPMNKQRVLREFVRLDDDDRGSVTDTTAALGRVAEVDLSSGTIKRLLYEMAEDGVVDLETVERSGKRGRPPSRVVPRFPQKAYRHLYDLRASSVIEPGALIGGN